MRQYEIFELTINGPVLHDNYAQVDLSAIFTDKSGSKQIKGFYAGDGVYKVRYMPEVTGLVSWTVSGVVSEEGSETCEPAEPGKHGIVRPKGTALVYADGSYFHSFGTTVYGLAHQTPELTETTMETLSQNPFNKVRMCLFPKHYDYNINDPEFLPFETKEGTVYKYEIPVDSAVTQGYLKEKAKIWDVTRPNIKFWDAFETKIKRLDELGIQVDLILFHPYDRWGFSYLSLDESLIYMDYLLRRFAAFPNVWWSMANEYDFCAAKSLEDWHAIDEFISESDPYRHMLSNHNCFRGYDFERETITHCSLQKRTMGLVPEYMEKYGKPVLYDECVYEGNLKQTWGSLSGQEMMNRFWKVTTHGGYCTHGEVYLDMDMKDIENAVLWWAKGGKLIGTSPRRIAFLRSLMEEIDKPLTPYGINFFKSFTIPMKGEVPEEVFDNMPAFLGRIPYYRNIESDIEYIRQQDQEIEFAGHTDGDEYILYYYGTDCCARVDVKLPEKGEYKIEVIDAWNMTRTVFKEKASGTIEVKLTGHEYMAVLATLIQE